MTAHADELEDVLDEELSADADEPGSHFSDVPPDPPRSVRPARATSRAVLREGDVVGRRYRIGAVAQRTGRLITVAARHLELDQPVELTYLVSRGHDDSRAGARFLRTARLAARVPTTHTAKVLDIGRLATDVPFAVLETLPGWTFAEVLRMRGPLPIVEAADYVIQACRAVAEAEAAGIRRTGVSPFNLLLTRNSVGAAVVKTVLFGANVTDPDEVLQTDFFRGESIDTRHRLLPYVAPEHVRDVQRHDESPANVWGLGVVLYELISGAPAFDAETATGLLAAIAADSPRELRRFHRETPPGLEDVIDRCLSKEPRDRYAGASELAKALEPFSQPRDVASTAPSKGPSRPPPLPGPASVAPRVRTIVQAERATTLSLAVKPRTVDRGLGVVAGIVLGITGLMGAQALRSESAAPPPPSPIAVAPTPAPTTTATEAVSAAPAQPAAQSGDVARLASTAVRPASVAAPTAVRTAKTPVPSSAKPVTPPPAPPEAVAPQHAALQPSQVSPSQDDLFEGQR